MTKHSQSYAFIEIGISKESIVDDGCNHEQFNLEHHNIALFGFDDFHVYIK